MSGKQQLVAAGGIGLIAANFWLGGAKDQVTAGGLFTKGAAPGTQTNAHVEIKKVAAELLFVGLAVLLSGVSDAAASAMLAIIAALLVLWAINHYTKQPK